MLGISAVSYDHTVEIPIRGVDGVLIRFSFSGRPIERYAVLLLVFRDGRWQEARVYDNHLGTHHLHRYSRTAGKHDAEAFHPGPTTAALPAAIQHLKDGWENIILSWER